jgi:coronin-1B/1C/6
VKIFDIEKGEEKFSDGNVPELIQDLKWSNDGKYLVSTSKDKNVNFFDPRKGASAAFTFEGHDGVKTSKVCFLGNENEFVTVGYSKSNKRQFKIWDIRDLSKQKHTEDVDSAAGVLLPFYDEAINVLLLAGKGDGNIRFYEIVNEAPFAYATGEYRSTKSQKGVCVLPKRGNNILACETTAVLKLHPDKVERIGMTIPRKSDKFQDDLFPDAPAGLPGCTSDEWWAGSDAKVVLTSLDPSKARKSSVSGGSAIDHGRLVKTKCKSCMAFK